ncbi:M14 family metallopeptidase [Halomonas sp. RT37]|uniref:M14 family metallopeptidase n=1 Tax=Halomonas sp. RT37 TaxID=2950872 RepID=A0AAU7KDK2_9GAMM
MTKYATGNPVLPNGSADPRDLFDNAQNLDVLVNSQEKTEHPDRLGVPRKTWHGMEQDFQQFLVNSGYTGTGAGGAYEDYDADGPLTITALNQLFTKDGEFYRLKPDQELPYTTTDWTTDEVNMVAVGDAALRQELASGVDSGQGGLKVKGAVIYVDSTAELEALPTDALADGQTVHVVDDGPYNWDASQGEFVKQDSELEYLGEKDKLSAVVGDLTEGASDPGVVNTVWEPIAQPPASDFVDTSNGGADSEGFINSLWEPLRAENPGWVSRTTLGKDESSTHNIYKYIFSPQDYDKTVVIGCSTHGSEIMNQIATAYFMREVATNWKGSQLLRWARWKVRWIIIPIVNPWGSSQNPRVRYNSNGVDLNRNWDYRWSQYVGDSAYGHDYKGGSAFSEVETRLFRNLAASHPDAVAIIDSHDFGGPASGIHYPCFGPDYPLSTSRSSVDRLIGNLSKDGEVSSNRSNANPSSFNWFAYNHNVHSWNPEFAPGLVSGVSFDSEDMTAAVRWFGNFYLQAATLYKPTHDTLVGPSARLYTTTTSVSMSSASSYQSVLPEDAFEVETNGFIEVNGHATFATNASGTYPETRVFLKHRFGQDGGYRDIFKSSDSSANIETYGTVDAGGRITLPFSMCIPVFAGIPIRLEPQAYIENIGGSLNRYSAVLRFTPADGPSHTWLFFNEPVDDSNWLRRLPFGDGDPI